MISFKLFFEQTKSTSRMLPLIDYFKKFKKYPFAIIIEGITAPMLQVLIRQPDNKYLITSY